MRAQILNPAAAMGCGLFIALLAAPMLLAAGVGLRGVDLERPGLTGLFIGLFCGAVAASIYGLHCGHATFLYVALWYSLGIALCGVVGAAGMKLTRRRLQTEPLHLHC